MVRADRDDFAGSHDRDLVRSALTGLTPDQQLVVALRFFADLSPVEIAERLQIPAGTVGSRLHYALKKLEEVIRASERDLL
jgi:RNA polymerase sigma-70 factor (ECF subfamily)